MKEKRGRPAIVNESTFTEMWEKSESLGDVARSLSTLPVFSGKTEETLRLYASIRAKNMRKGGHQLKELRRTRNKKTLSVSE